MLKKFKQDIFGLLFILLALLILASLISFNVYDTEFFASHTNHNIQNWIGITGAYLSATSVLIFGMASYGLVLVFALTGIFLVRHIFLENLLPFIVSFILLIALSGFFAASSFSHNSLYLFGGTVGELLFQYGKRYTGKIGFFIIDVFFILASIIFIFKINFIFLLKSFFSFLSRIFHKKESSRDIKTIPVRKKPPLIQKVRYKINSDEDAPSEVDEDIDDEELEPEVTPSKMERSLDFTESKLEKLKGKKTKGQFPSLSLLHVSPKVDLSVIKRDIAVTSQALEDVLNDFGIKVKVIGTEIGPVITRYELKVAPGIRVSKIVGLSNNIALSLAAQRVRIVAPIPGKAAIGIEVPNSERRLVTLGDLFALSNVKKGKILDFYLGLDISGDPIILNLREAPHMLIAGATGSGKSVCLSTIICSFLYTCPADEVKFIMVDPKMVELKIYNDIGHLLTEVITNPKKASLALKWLVNEMEKRYKLMEQLSARDISRYNMKAQSKNKPEEFPKMPYIVLIVDELADLMMVSPKDVEESIARLAQKARAVGIHLILATQRPSVDVITGLIKANFPSRIAFQVASKIDSRTILDQNGAEQLLGKGDMLMSFAASPELVRVQGAFLSDDEVYDIVQDVKKHSYPHYDSAITSEESIKAMQGNDMGDEVYAQALELVKTTRKASASFLQRRLSIGFNRAARYIEMMEEQGLVGPPNKSKPREVYIDEDN